MEALLIILEKLIFFVKHRERDNRIFYEEIIKPAYEEFELIIGKYFDFFSSASKLLAEADLDEAGHAEKIFAILNTQREEYVQARLKLSAACEAIAEGDYDTKVEKIFVEMADSFVTYGQIIGEGPSPGFEVRSRSVQKCPYTGLFIIRVKSSLSTFSVISA